MSKKEAWSKAFRETDLETVFRNIDYTNYKKQSLTVVDRIPTKLIHFMFFCSYFYSYKIKHGTVNVMLNIVT